MKTWKKLIMAIVVVGLSSCKSTNAPHQAQFFNYFDTLTQLIYYGEANDFEWMKQFTEERLSYYHQLFNKYELFDHVTNVKSINERKEKTLDIDPELYELIQKGTKASLISNGHFSIGMKDVYDLWQDFRDKKRDLPPGETELKHAAVHTNLSDLEFIDEHKRIIFHDPLLRLDLGAIAKGYAVNKIANELKEKGFQNFALNAGGDLTVVGTPFGKKKWSVGIKDPTEGICKTLYINDLSVATSGDYERMIAYQEKNYHHIIDALTLYPKSFYHSVTVVGEDVATCDFLATALFCMEEEEAMVWLNNFSGYEAFFIRIDNSQLESSQFKQYLQ